MAKSEEVIIIENENGEMVREFMQDTNFISLYKNMRETLIFLTHLDYDDTGHIMAEKLTNTVNGMEFSWKNLNTLCWAIGSISGALTDMHEERFVIKILTVLMGRLNFGKFISNSTLRCVL